MEGIGLEYGLWTLLKASYSGRMYEQSDATGSEGVSVVHRRAAR